MTTAAVGPATGRSIEFVSYVAPNPRMLLVTGSAAVGAVWSAFTQENAVTLGLALVALGGVVGPPVGKAVKWFFRTRREEQVTSLKEFGQVVADAERKAARAEAKAESLQEDLDEMKAENAKLKADIEALKRQNVVQASDVDRLKEKQADVATALNKQKDAIKTVAKRVIEVETAVTGSNSNLNIPAVGGDTAVDMPTGG